MVLYVMRLRKTDSSQFKTLNLEDRVRFGAAVFSTNIWRRPFGAGVFWQHPFWR